MSARTKVYERVRKPCRLCSKNTQIGDVCPYCIDAAKWLERNPQDISWRRSGLIWRGTRRVST